MADMTCKICGEPRFVRDDGKLTLRLCHKHLKEYYRDQNTKKISKSPEIIVPICRLCHRTPQAAAVKAVFQGVWCQSCTPLGTPINDLTPRLHVGSEITIMAIDVGKRVARKIVGREVETTPLADKADVKNHIRSAAKNGYVIGHVPKGTEPIL